MAKFRVTVTRLIEEECFVYVDAKDGDEATDKALDLVADTPEAIWVKTDTEPHTYSVDRFEDAANPKEFT